jgi:hypothetical protein
MSCQITSRHVASRQIQQLTNNGLIMEMSATITRRVEFIYAQLRQGKSVPLRIRDEQGNYRDVLELLRDRGIRIPKAWIRHVALRISPERIEGESEELWRSRSIIEQVGFQVRKRFLNRLKPSVPA